MKNLVIGIGCLVMAVTFYLVATDNKSVITKVDEPAKVVVVDGITYTQYTFNGHTKILVSNVTE